MKNVDQLPPCKYTDYVLNEFIKKNQGQFTFSRKLRRVQMKSGQLWQVIMGHVDGIHNLDKIDKTGLDLISDETFPRGKFVMELKNATNTDNKSSRTYNFLKLKNFVNQHPEYTAIYACVNDRAHNEGRDEIKMIDELDNFKVRFLTGEKLLKFVFGNDSDQVLKYFKESMYKFFV
jgi:hypothetical protein